MMGFGTPYPKVLQLSIEHFKLEEFEKTRNRKVTLTFPLLFFPEAGHKTLM